MKRFILKLGRCLIIYIVIFMTILTGVTYGYSQEEVGDAIAGFAAHVVSDYSSHVTYSQNLRLNNPIWSNSYSWSDLTYYFDCSSFATGCYHEVAGLFSSALPTSSLLELTGSEFEKGVISSMSDLMPGDLIVRSGHAFIYVGEDYSGGSDKYSTSLIGDSTHDGSYWRNTYHYIFETNSSVTFYYIRISETAAASLTDLDTEFANGNVSSSSSTSSAVDLSNFYFNGIPDGTYSIASTNIWTTIVDSIASIANYLIGILTYIIRVVIVGWTSIIDRLFNWSINEANNPSTSSEDLGISGSEVEETDSSSRLTLEALFYGEYDLVDIDIFGVEIEE